MKNGIARFLAILFGSILMTSTVSAFDLMTPKKSSDPIALEFADTEIEGVNPATQLQIYFGTLDDCCAGKTPIAGRYSTKGNVISFAPAFGFDPGQNYVAQIVTTDGEERIPFRLPVASETVPATVTQIYPSGNVLPENILRFYIHFSSPMTPHVAFDYIKLRDESGKADEAAFMRFKQELWNEDRTRLTLLIDPGRIKRSVATNLELGPALIAGQNYTLTVDGGWPSADGTSMLPSFSKPFAVAQSLRKIPDVSQWQHNEPCRGSHEPLQLHFDRPFDRHLLSKDIRVITEHGPIVAGAISVGQNERSWSFTPNSPWSGGKIFVEINPTLEDVAANNFNDLLDHSSDTSEKISSIRLPVNLSACAN